MSYFGDYALETTFDIKFTTRRFSTGAPHALAGSPVISAYPGNSTTELTAGITLSADFDSRTGLNNVRVVATAANGYATATNYALVITTGTVDSISVAGEVIGSFSLEARSALRPTVAARTLDVSSGGEAGVDWANVGTAGSTVNLSATTTNLVNTVTTYTGNTLQTGDNYARLGAPAGASVSADVAAVKVDTAAVKTKTDFLPSATAGGAGGVFIAGSNAATSITTALTANITGNLSGSVGSVTGAVGSVTGLTASDVGSIKTKTDSLTFTVSNQVDANAIAISGATGSADRLERSTLGIVTVTCGAGSSTTSVIASSISPSSIVNDQFKGRIITFDANTTTTALRGQATDITAYTHATLTFTVTALTTAPASGDTFVIT